MVSLGVVDTLESGMNSRTFELVTQLFFLLYITYFIKEKISNFMCVEIFKQLVKTKKKILSIGVKMET